MDPREKPYRISNPFTVLMRHFISEISHGSKSDSQVVTNWDQNSELLATSSKFFLPSCVAWHSCEVQDFHALCKTTIL